MLNIYYGREKLNREKFIYESIGADNKPALIMVPDQYTLEAEKQAFNYLKTESLINAEVISMSRFGYKLLCEEGGLHEQFIDKYGRHMILSSVARRKEEEMQVFKGTLAKNSFIELVNNFISDMKQAGISPAELKSYALPLNEDSLLGKKIKDLALMYEEYEKVVEGKYTDSEDYIDLYMSKIKDSKVVARSNIWIYGFDSFAPKALKVIGCLMERAPSVNIVLTYDEAENRRDLFQLSKLVMNNLSSIASEKAIECNVSQIDDSFAFSNKGAASKAIEENLYALKCKGCETPEGFKIVKCANLYSEAESAAAYIYSLVRDKGLRFKDIVVICNDQKTRSSILERMFREYGIRYFADEKRSILNSPVVIFILSLLEGVAEGYQNSHIFKMLKTGFFPMENSDVEELENYVIKYRIKGNMWKKPFLKGVDEYGEEGLEEINLLRGKVVEALEPVREMVKEGYNVSQFINAYYDYLCKELNIEEEIHEFMDIQREMNLMDLADETSQIWTKVCEILDQMVEIAGEEKLDSSEFIHMFTAGLSQIEVGVLPQGVDECMVGTMQRTRAGDVKALVVVGANEGVLPADLGEDALFSDEELEYLGDEEKALAAMSKVKSMEEQLAIYRNLSKAEESIWISYSVSGEDGESIRASELIEQLHRIFPGAGEDVDIRNKAYNFDDLEEIKKLVGGPIINLRRGAESIGKTFDSDHEDNEDFDEIDLMFRQYMEEKEPELKVRIDKAANIGKMEKLPVSIAGDLFGQGENLPLSLSPSRVEKYGLCPFSHFVSYGLRPEERRIYQASHREIGDLYHRVLMDVSSSISKENMWDSISAQECDGLVHKALNKEVQDYGEGIFYYSNEEKYKTSRIEQVCRQVCWNLVMQVRTGEIKHIDYEVGFGRGRKIKPIIVKLENKKVYIEGVIDRVDILENDRVKIIDYKTGNEKFKIDEAEAGFRLQLMVYLIAAEEEMRKPAGVFYFHVREPRASAYGASIEDTEEKVLEHLKKAFRLDGVMVNEPSVVAQIAGEFDKSSDVVDIKRLASGELKKTNALVSEEDFKKVEDAVKENLKLFCENMVSGNIEITPMRGKWSTACDHCKFGSICKIKAGYVKNIFKDVTYK